MDTDTHFKPSAPEEPPPSYEQVTSGGFSQSGASSYQPSSSFNQSNKQAFVPNQQAFVPNQHAFVPHQQGFQYVPGSDQGPPYNQQGFVYSQGPNLSQPQQTVPSAQYTQSPEMTNQTDYNVINVVMSTGLNPNDPSQSKTPVNMKCPYCQHDITTETEYVTGSCTYLACMLCGMLGFILCCCLPFLVDEFKDVVHTCPKCDKQVGHWHRQQASSVTGSGGRGWSGVRRRRHFGHLGRGTAMAAARRRRQRRRRRRR